MATPQMRWAGDLADVIEEAGGLIRPARHVLARLAAVLYPEKWQYVDVDFVGRDHGRVDGAIVVFTEQLVAITTVKGMKPMGFAQDSHEGSEASVVVVPRASLTRIELAPFALGDIPVNSSPEWQLRSDDMTSWPFGGRLALHYEGVPEPVILPGGRNTEEFQRFLPELREDLVR